MSAELRIRRLDRHCFVVETKTPTTRWTVEAYCNTVQLACRVALATGIHGDGVRELQASVNKAENRVIRALKEMVRVEAKRGQG